MRQFLVVVFGALLLFGGAAFFAARARPAAVAARPALAQQQRPSGAPLTGEEQAQGRERARRARLLSLAALCCQGALLAGFFAFGGSRWLAGLVARLNRHWLLGLAAVLGIFTVAGTVLTLPLDYYAGYLFNREYGLATQTPAGWLRDYAVAAGVGALQGLPVLALVYALFRWRPRSWWLWVTAASVPISLFFILIEPVFVAPLFNTFTPLKDAKLRQEILAMAHRQGIQANDVFQVDASRQSRAVNAYVNGVGPTQRIVLYDTLLDNFTHAEIKYVMAHEMGHYVLKHIPWGVFFAIFGTLVGGLALHAAAGAILRRWDGSLGYATLEHPASYPLLLALAMALSLATVPVASALSRQMERQADRYAARINHNYAAGISLFNKMARMNIVEIDPPRWAQVLFGTHPTIRERIQTLEALRRQHGGS